MLKQINSTKTANVNVRLYPEIKEEAERVFGYHDLTLPEAITMFINHTCHAGDFPFDLKNVPYTDPASLAALEEAKHLEKDPKAKTFRTTEDLIADCLSDDDD